MGKYGHNQRNSIKVATVISYITLIIGNLISLIYTPYMLSKLGRAEYGLFTLVNTIIAYIYLLDMGLGNAIVRYNSKYIAENNENQIKKVNGMFLTMYFIIALIGLIIGTIIYFNLESIFSKGLTISEIHKIKIMFIFAIINLMVSFPLNVFSGIITANERFTYLKLLALVRTTLNPVIMLLVLFIGYRSIGMIIASSLFNILLGLVNVWYCFKILKIKITFSGFDKELCKEIFNFSIFIFLSSIAYKIYWSTDQIILGMFVSSTSISIYTIGSQFNTYFTSFSNVISSMFLPKLTKIVTVEKDMKKLIGILVRVSRIQFFISSFILTGFILLGKSFIYRWAGKDYDTSYYIALLLMVPQVFSIIQSLFATMLEALNKHRVKSYIYLGVAVFNLIVSLYLVRIWGVLGCALGTTIGMLINALLNNLYYKFKLKLNMSYYWGQIVKLVPAIIISGILGYLITMVIKPQSYFTILLSAILFTMIYFVACWFFAFNEYEKSIIAGVCQKAKVVINIFNKRMIASREK